MNTQFYTLLCEVVTRDVREVDSLTTDTTKVTKLRDPEVMPPIESSWDSIWSPGHALNAMVPLCVCISSHEGACHDFLVILAMPTTSAHGTSVAIPLYSPYHTAITFEPLCSHIKPEGLTSSPLRGPTQWLVYNGPQWFRLYTTSPLRGPTRMLDAHPCSRARGFGRGTMSLVAHYPRV